MTTFQTHEQTFEVTIRTAIDESRPSPEESDIAKAVEDALVRLGWPDAVVSASSLD